ncbi:HdeD family acid-resistance protein [Paracidovorax citrulli]
MIRLALILLGFDYLRQRARGMFWLGVAFLLAGIVLFIDGLDGAAYFPLEPFALLLMAGGVGTLVVAFLGAGGMRSMRVFKGLSLMLAASLVLAGHHHGHFWLSMIFGTLFLLDGVLQCISASVVRFPRWRFAVGLGLLEILIAVFFFQPYPAHYRGTVPYALALWLLFGGWSMVMLAYRAMRVPETTTVESLMHGPRRRARAGEGEAPDAEARSTRTGTTQEPLHKVTKTLLFAQPQRPPTAPSHEDRALTVHVWTPSDSPGHSLRRRPLVDRYIAAVDANGAIWTGHTALESPEGIYISFDPATPLNRTPDSVAQALRASSDNDVPGQFEPDYASESARRGGSTARVHLRNYDAARLERFWHAWRSDTTYNLTYRNCAVSVARGLEAALEGALMRRRGNRHSWGLLLRTMLTPELWLAAQIRKRGKTMAWTPGLVRDYARALSLLVDSHPRAQTRRTWRLGMPALRRLRRQRRVWQREDDGLR